MIVLTLIFKGRKEFDVFCSGHGATQEEAERSLMVAYAKDREEPVPTTLQELREELQPEDVDVPGDIYGMLEGYVLLKHSF